MEQKSNDSDGRVIIGKHFCLHCGSRLDRYLWRAVTQLEKNDKITISARGTHIPEGERIASLLRTLGCVDVERKVINEVIEGNKVETLLIIIGKQKKLIDEK